MTERLMTGDRRPSAVFYLSTRALLACALAAVVLGVLIGCAILQVRAQVKPRGFDHAGYIKTWNDVAESIDKQNPLLRELQEDVNVNPPGRVRSARRMELLDQIIEEHERQLKDFKALRAAER
jgi:hypothetical protein